MTKEQNEAIEYFINKIIDAKPQYIETMINGKIIKEEVCQIKMRFDHEESEKMKIILNMLKEKDNIIEGKECVIETQAYNEEVLLNTLKKKDKIIDYLLRACLHSIVSGEKFTLEINNKKYEDKDIDVRIEQLRKFVAEKAEQSSGINTTPEKN